MTNIFESIDKIFTFSVKYDIIILLMILGVVFLAKSLIISDLDGTLLNSEGKLSKYTIETLNWLMSCGVCFTFATARTIYSAKPITDGLNINVPCILNNGASVYDMETGKYIKNAYISQEVSRKIISAFRANGVNCFMFRCVDNVLSTGYDKVTDELMQSYVEERKNKFLQPFFECDDLLNEISGNEIYINSTGSYDSLLPIKNAVAEIAGADFAFYKDTYTDKWFLETFSSEASKVNGLKFLRKKYGFEHITAFGDNLNDLSMFKEADFKIAVGNAHDEVKSIADLIVDTNENNGVAKELKERFLFNMSIGAI